MGLFAHYEAQPGAIRGSADELIAGSRQVSAVKSAVVAGQQTAMSAVSGTLLAPLSTGSQPVISSASATSGAAVVASGALDLFATAVDDYNSGVDRLNEQYEAAKANNFGVLASSFSGPQCGTESTPEQSADQFAAAVISAGDALRASLTGELARLKEVLDTAADTAAGILTAGPSEASLLVLAANGALPAFAQVEFPEFFKSFKNDKLVFDQVKNAYSLYGVGKNVLGVRDKLAFDRAALALLQGKNLANAELRAVLQIAGGNMDDVRVIDQIARRTEDLAPLRAAVAAGNNFDMLDAAASTSKFSKFLGAVGIAGAVYDIGWNPGNHTGARRVANVGFDVIGGGAAIGGLAVAAGIITAPIAGPIILAAGAAALAYGVTTTIVDNWDSISSGVQAADAWVNEKVDQAVDDVADWAEEKAESIPVIGGLF